MAKKVMMQAKDGFQWLSALATFPEDLSSVLSTCVRQLTTTCDSNSRGSDDLSWPL